MRRARFLEVGLGVLPFLGLLAVWWLATHLTGMSRAQLPSPEAVWAAGRDLAATGELQDDILISLGRVALGAAVSIALGVGLGLVAGLNRAVGDLLLPLASFFNSVSGIAWIPLAITWFGLGTAAVTFIMSGIRSGLGFGWRALIAAELIAATSGLGFLIYDASNFLRSDKILVGILVIGAIWMVIDSALLKPLERRTVERWATVRVL
jgi:NitT/TauT family transport system permease protein/taurine transport system permease protein